ncbi:MAG: heavy metal translocating P-type ATPase [Usitatibacter sp.]
MAEAALEPPGAESAACFHCGLPVPRGVPWGFEAAGEWRAFCCAGCEAVARVISGEGLDRYYRLRSAAPPPLAGRPDADYRLYDEPAVQARFVREAAGGCREVELVVEGIRCAACAWLIETAVSRVAGVASLRVNATTREARLAWDPSAGPLSAIFDAVRRVGYRAWPREEGVREAVERRERRALVRRLWVAGLGMMQVMMYALPAYVAADGDMTADAAGLMRWAGLALTAPVMAYSALPFYRGAWRDARAGRAGMDLPVAIGLAAAFLASAWATLRGSGPVYFDSVTMFVFLLLGGRCLEHLARERAARSLAHLTAFIPEGAWRLVDESRLEAEQVLAATLRAGDRVLVRAGEPAPADGILASPRASVSEALLSGESRVVERESGSRIVGGSINCASAFVMRVTEVGASTVMGTIRAMVERAAAERPRWVEAAERASHAFVLSVLAIALAAALAWLAIDPQRALWVAVSVLIVTCPCALSLATPVAMTVATGALARRNLVVTRAHAVEALAAATDFVFDKTGTLTMGAPRVVEVMTLGAESAGECLAIAAALARGSTHPLDRAFVEAAAEAPLLEVDGHRATPGEGLEARVGGRRVRLGRASYASIPHGKPAPETWTPAGDTVVWLADERGWLAAFRLGDAIRPGARECVEALRRRGVAVHLLTGDEPGVARRVGAELGIDRVDAGATPERKKAYVRALQLAGARVAMVGDGINDAPVLAQADVSIAMGGGASLAQVRADAVLLSDSLGDLAAALALARRTRAVMRENLAWALAYNVVAIPLALAGLVTPLVAGIGMSASSLAVVANALRLRR